MSRFSFTKCQGTGNDFVLLDRTAAGSTGEFDWPAVAQALCDRHYAVGADGLLVLELSPALGCDVALQIFNADGSAAEMCGNGVRCVARYLHDRRPERPQRARIWTTAGPIETEVVAGQTPFTVRVAMGVPERIHAGGRRYVLGTSADVVDVTIGNPHAVAFVDANLLDVDLASFAQAIAGGGDYPSGVNVEVARVFANGLVAMRVQERGVGETLGCGTGACAVAIAAIKTGRVSSPVGVQMQGGDVAVEWEGSGNQVFLSGGADLVFDAVIDIAEETAEQPAAAP